MGYDTRIWDLHGYVEATATDDGQELMPVDAPDAGVYVCQRSSTGWGLREHRYPEGGGVLLPAEDWQDDWAIVQQWVTADGEWPTDAELAELTSWADGTYAVRAVCFPYTDDDGYTSVHGDDDHYCEPGVDPGMLVLVRYTG